MARFIDCKDQCVKYWDAHLASRKGKLDEEISTKGVAEEKGAAEEKDAPEVGQAPMTPSFGVDLEMNDDDDMEVDDRYGEGIGCWATKEEHAGAGRLRRDGLGRWQPLEGVLRNASQRVGVRPMG